MKRTADLNRCSITGRKIPMQMGTLGVRNILLVALLSGVALAQAGQLDKTFATAGVFTTNNTLATPVGDNVIAIQSDGKIIVGGGIGANAVLMRLNTDGTLDNSFGTGGIVSERFDFAHDPQVVGLAIQSDGKILAAMNTNDFFPPPLVARFKTNGSLDTTFGTSGSTNLLIAGVTALALQADGKILVAGGMSPTNVTAPGAMTRLTANGQLDSSFGTSGVAVAEGPSATALVLQSDGKILVTSGGFWISGTALPAFPTGNLGIPQPGSIARYNPNGSLDKTFGISGQAACVASASAIALQSNGKIVVAGSITSQLIATPAANDTGFGLVRYNADGSIDTAFGRRGGIITGFSHTGPLASAFGLAIQANGDIVATGQVGQENGFTPGPSSFALARYTSGGRPDTTFGPGGTVVTTLGSSNTSFIAVMTLQSDGKIVAAGNSEFSTPQGFVNNFAVARYLGQ